MRVCIPTTQDLGLDSPICEHFGSAPLFSLFDLATGRLAVVPNPQATHEPGTCRPIDHLTSWDVGAVVVRGIGAGAAAKLTALGIAVLATDGDTVGAGLASLADREVAGVGPGGTCRHHHHDRRQCRPAAGHG